eukprot:ANDGO_01404.mRNA.1 hypothetical protein
MDEFLQQFSSAEMIACFSNLCPKLRSDAVLLDKPGMIELLLTFVSDLYADQWVEKKLKTKLESFGMCCVERPDACWTDRVWYARCLVRQSPFLFEHGKLSVEDLRAICRVLEISGTGKKADVVQKISAKFIADRALQGSILLPKSQQEPGSNPSRSGAHVHKNVPQLTVDASVQSPLTASQTPTAMKQSSSSSTPLSSCSTPVFAFDRSPNLNVSAEEKDALVSKFNANSVLPLSPSLRTSSTIVDYSQRTSIGRAETAEPLSIDAPPFSADQEAADVNVGREMPKSPGIEHSSLGVSSSTGHQDCLAAYLTSTEHPIRNHDFIMKSSADAECPRTEEEKEEEEEDNANPLRDRDQETLDVRRPVNDSRSPVRSRPRESLSSSCYVRRDVSHLRDAVFGLRNDIDMYTRDHRSCVVLPEVDHIWECQLADFAVNVVSQHEQKPVVRDMSLAAENLAAILNDVCNLNVTHKKWNEAKKGPFTAFLNRYHGNSGSRLRSVSLQQMINMSKSQQRRLTEDSWDSFWSNVAVTMSASHDVISSRIEDAKDALHPYGRAGAVLGLFQEELHTLMEALKLDDIKNSAR